MSPPEFLTRLEGTTVIINQSSELRLHVGPKNWEIVSKVQERINIVSQRDATNGLGPAYLAGKLLCRLASPSSPDILTFMRIYKQIPIAGTEFEKASIRAMQAVNSHEPKELTALKSLEEKGCDVVPRLLGYQTDQQDGDDIVPGGFVTYVIWAKVPGESLDIQEFWSCSFSRRSDSSSATSTRMFSGHHYSGNGPRANKRESGDLKRAGAALVLEYVRSYMTGPRK